MRLCRDSYADPHLPQPPASSSSFLSPPGHSVGGAHLGRGRIPDCGLHHPSGLLGLCMPSGFQIVGPIRSGHLSGPRRNLHHDGGVQRGLGPRVDHAHRLGGVPVPSVGLAEVPGAGDDAGRIRVSPIRVGTGRRKLTGTGR